jgi:glutamate synthase domain-containing protein 2/glutamate synthase domain-containing protein 1/glutamate synthase domain-containing protein 3
MGDRSACTSPAPARRAPLYDARLHERDACGIGFVADLHGRPSRAMVEHALEGLERLRHRGAVAADARTGDGAGLLLPIDQEFYAAPVQGKGPLGLAMAFLPADRDQAKTAMVAVERALVAEGLELERWRPVPVDPEALGDQARASMPAIEQAVFRAPGASDEEAERRCLRAGRRAVADGRAAGAHLYLASCSTRTVTYKALCAADQLAAFYTDLADERLRAPFAIFHQRYSTNTTPSWERAQPFRFLCHNGEINTLEGNRAWMRAREGSLGAAALAGPDGTDPEGLLRPVLDPDGSDSTMLDNAVELLVRGGRDVRHALTMLVPAAVEQDPEASDELRDFYRYHARLTEPWDGPAGLVFTDGRVVGATLDRNGLRPLRYEVCEDGLVVCASEVGAIDVAGHGAVRRGRLGPGQMLCVNPNAGRASAMDSSTADEPEDGSMRAAHVRPAFADAGLQTDVDIKEALARSRPWSDWLAAHLRAAPLGEPMPVPEEDLTAAQVAFGFTRELISTVLRPMATGGKEPTASMGDDTPPAVLAATARPVSHYLRQRFAQVTNPPIDHLRERHVLSKRTLLGPRSPLLSELPEAARLIELETFLLTPDGVERLLEMAAAGRPGTEAAAAGRLPFTARVLDATWPVDEGPAGLRAACRRLGDEAAAAVRGGAGLLVVRDHAGGDGSGRAPVPALLAIGAVQHRLVRAGLATAASLVADTCEPVDAHHAAALLGYGAGAICPRLGLATAASLAKDGDAAAAQARYLHAVEEGVFKVMSKMGISTLDSYRGAQIFEAVGLDAEVVGVCFAGTASPLGGIGFDELGEDVLARHAAAGAEAVRLDNPGWFKHRPGGEYHATNPEVMQALHHTVREDAELRGSKRGAHLLQQAVKGGTFERYQHFAKLVNERRPAALRDLLAVEPAGPPLPLDEVEPAAGILRRFSTAAMSLGSLSPEAHESLAIALNRVGGRSNSGEGGEDPARLGTERTSAIKQVASGRFGVTPEYLASAVELQIKIAQGSKPGEGGQLPGHKVSRYIAKLRYTQPGVALISPPPHHDIYSIEDLAQLVFDLKQANPGADVTVKLVAEAGVGTVAAGVVKSLADVVTISGADGGTGASPLSSIKHAGAPWELGLAETQQALRVNGLRSRVRVRVDGGLKTGRDVLLAALLGADEYGFGTAALLAEGCLMVRTCHQDNCPVGIATQREDLRAKFTGTPEMVVHYLEFVAEELRRLLASLGLRSLDEAIGRVDLLRQRPTGDPRADKLDLGPLLEPGDGVGAGAPRRFVAPDRSQTIHSPLGDRVAAEAIGGLEAGDLVHLRYPIANTDRAVGARLGVAIASRYGTGTPSGRARIEFAGTAGQSFGAFLAAGVELRLEGPANDYVGKGMGGGRLVIRPPAGDAGEPVLVGNTALYGATGGELFCAGRAGERFAVRNSGATAVIEGTGDHCCEYMTGGTVVVLGPVGRNLGAGMTGGEVFLWDQADSAPERLNGELVLARRPDDVELVRLRELIVTHAELTGSAVAAAVLAGWDRAAGSFWRVAPRDEVAAIERAHEGTA